MAFTKASVTAFNNKLAQLEAVSKAGLDLALRDTAKEVVREMKDEVPPVKPARIPKSELTGNLQKSIRSEKIDSGISFKADATRNGTDYASIYEHGGNKTQEPRPFFYKSARKSLTKAYGKISIMITQITQGGKTT